MEQILQDLKSQNGVDGVFVFDARGSLLGAAMPPAFQVPRLLGLGRSLAKLHAAGKTNFPELSEGFLAFEGCVLAVRAVVDKVFLVLLGSADLNLNLAALSMNVAVEELRDDLESRKGAPAPPAPAPSASPAELMAAGPLAPLLEAMQAALAKFVGPMAKVIFIECVDSWAKVEPPSRSSLPRLIEMVAHEIGDPRKSEAYRQAVAELLRTH